MKSDDRDPISGHATTGHEWNGIRELDAPVPRAVLIFLIVTHVFAVLWWFLMPTWPLGSTYTKGLLGIDQRAVVERDLRESAAKRAGWVTQIETSDFAAIQANPQLMEIVRQTGHQLFGDNCAACHGANATGGAGYPDLTDDDWLWGGSPQDIAETMRVGINSMHSQARFAQMPAFGRDQMLSRSEVRNVAAYVYALGNPEYATAERAEEIQAGQQVFASMCASCHAADGTGMREVGAPNLTDHYWVYGGDLATIIASIHGGRQGHMPTWDERLTPAEIKILALYVHSLGSAK